MDEHVLQIRESNLQISCLCADTSFGEIHVVCLVLPEGHERLSTPPVVLGVCPVVSKTHVYCTYIKSRSSLKFMLSVLATELESAWNSVFSPIELDKFLLFAMFMVYVQPS